MIKRLLVALFIGIVCTSCYAVEPVLQSSTAQNLTSTVPITTPQNINFADCTKIYPIDKEGLLVTSLAAIEANKYNIEEIQSSNGYVMFSAFNRKYLATIAEIDKSNSILKITPCNNTYFYPPAIFLNVFRYIDVNLK